MGKYKLLALDMDGTLLNEEKEISAENRKWIAEASKAGITVILSTGRSFADAISYAEMLDLQTPMITVNGSEVWKAPHELLFRHFLPAETVRRLHDLALRYNTWYWGYTADRLYNKNYWDTNADSSQWLKFGYNADDPAVIEAIVRELQSWGGLEITNSALDNIEVNPHGISKASGIHAVCDLLGLHVDQAVAVGDSINDLAAIEIVGLGVAMGNAQDIVKQAADIVVASNEEDGVAQLIRDYVLK